MIREAEYCVLMTFGGGSWNSLNDSYRIAKYRNKALTVDSFLHIIHKAIAYGWISGKKDGLPVVCYESRFGITQKGSIALEYYKDMRYHHTIKKNLLSKEGKAMITLPGQRYKENVNVE